MTGVVLEADYVIVGAGAAGMAFADSLLAESDASIIMVDRRHKPGGHWNDTYPFVRLHAPSALYGVNSLPLGSGNLDRAGPNAGLQELASGAEICAYFDQVMCQRLLPSGRVTWLPLSDYGAGGEVTSRITGTRHRVRARRRIVDATLADTRVPATHPPDFLVSPGVRLVTPDALPRLGRVAGGFTVIGAGKTAMDTAVWLLDQGVDPAAITWIRPRDAWLINRAHVQTDFAFFEATIGGFAAEFEAARDATCIDDLFARLEAAEHLRRIDRDVLPSMFRCAIASDAELRQMRRITRVVRLGHVQSIEAGRIVLDHGAIPTSPEQVHIHCCADGIPRQPPQPVFQEGRIALQYLRRCSPTFSAALIAYLEASIDGDAEKNQLCTPVMLPDQPLDWLRMLALESRNAARWRKLPALRKWLAGARLNAVSAMIERALREPAPGNMAALERYRNAVGPGMTGLCRLLGEAA